MILTKCDKVSWNYSFDTLIRKAFRLASVNLILLGVIIFLPVLGEFSRITLPFLNREVLLSDVLIPFFILFNFAQLLLTGTLSSLFQLKSTKILSLFLLVAGLSLLYNFPYFSLSELLESSMYLVRYFEYAALLPITFALIKQNPEYKSIILKLLLISAILTAIGGLVQLQIYPDLRELESLGYDPHQNRLVGSWLDPNFIGGFFSIIITLILPEIIDKIKSWKKLLSREKLTTLIYSATAILLSLCTFLTYSRSAYITLAIGVTIVCLFKSPKLLVTLFVLAGLVIPFSERATERLLELQTSISSLFFGSETYLDPTARLRLESWQQTIYLIEQKPIIGHGFNTLKFVNVNEGFSKSLSKHSGSGSDSSLLTVAATTGILGLIFFVYFFIHLLFQNFLIFRGKIKPSSTTKSSKSTPNQPKNLNLGNFAAISGLLVHSIFINSLFFPQILIPFFIIQALSSTSSKK